MEETKMNILVLGNSGAGKSTLIEAIAGVKKNTRPGEADTAKIEVSESSIWPLRCIDTKGFEYSIIEQIKTIWQVKKYTKTQIVEIDNDSKEKGIDAVWYCVEGTARRVFSHNVDMMNKAIKGWKRVPVFAVITKSFSQVEEEENIEAAVQAFAKNKSVNLQKIIPVIAKPYPVNDDVIVQPKGIEELCNATLECSDYAKQINKENRDRMVLEQKRFTANAIIVGATLSAVVVGAVPLSFADSLLLVPLEIGMTKAIFKNYGVRFSSDLVSAIVGSALITNVAKAALAQLKTIPNIAASVINAVVAGLFVGILGEAVIAVSESIYRGYLDPAKIDDIVNFILDKIKVNPIIGSVISYLETNADKLKGKDAKTIFDRVQKAVAKSAKT
jgi:uncharacterized protein (DUF697 family)/GTPase SAR1 family protein